MRDRIGVFLMEDADGKVNVQLYEDPDKLYEMFDGLAGQITDPPSRATAIKVVHGPDGIEVDARTVQLPKALDPAKEPDGWRIGEGPITLPKEDKTD